MRYKDAAIYFMTGTGNSYRVATWIGEAAQGRGTDSRVIPFEKAAAHEEAGAGPEHLVGIVMPTHGFTSPWPIMRFAARGLPQGRGTHAFVAPTRGGTRIGGGVYRAQSVRQRTSLPSFCG